VHEFSAISDSDQSEELVISKLHGSIDWTYFSGQASDEVLGLHPVI
jgi:hypothetical protein